MQPARFIGLMSGTSLDGVDAALVRFDGGDMQLEARRLHPMPASIRQSLRSIISGSQIDLGALGALDAALADLFSEAVLGLLRNADVSATSVRAVGSHGQTVWHDPDATPPTTLQLGDPNRIAASTGLDVVADFRRADIALGGQGAPLAPGFHAFAFHHPKESRGVVNIGGMANLTVLEEGGDIQGHDTGPGNVLMDEWASEHLGKDHDPNGEWAAGGKPVPDLLEAMLNDPWLQRPAPKSTGREHFNRQWLESFPVHSADARDIQATLLALTVESISREVEAAGCERILVCGGGARNRTLMSALARRLAPRPVQDTGAHGLDPDWVEAAAFAWLARETLADRPGNIPAVTGASRRAILGGVWRGDSPKGEQGRDGQEGNTLTPRST